MAPQKQTPNDATSKGRAIATTWGKVSLPTSNQPPDRDIGSISLQKLFADIQSSQQQEDQFFQML